MRGMAITTTSIGHIRFTVTDIERSRAFYEAVFGWRVLIELPEGADTATREALSFLFGGVIYDLGGVLVGLRPAATDRFDENRTGLDHVAFRTDQQGRTRLRREHISIISASPTNRSRTSARPTSSSSAIPTTSRWS